VRPGVMDAYRRSNEKHRELYTKLAQGKESVRPDQTSRPEASALPFRQLFHGYFLDSPLIRLLFASISMYNPARFNSI
jgi:hypothetical protein